jgi:diguanylate cyclase (GGDEF)-like protein
MEIRVILYINIFLLAGYSAGLSIIALHSSRYRQFFWFAFAYAGADVGTVMRLRPWHVPDFFPFVLSNLLIVAALLLIHRCLAAFMKAEFNTGWFEAVLLIGTFTTLTYYTLVRPSLAARSLFLTLVLLIIGALSVYVLIRKADPAVRTPCRATAALYIVFGSMLIFRVVWFSLRGGQKDFFDYSLAHLIGFMGFYVLITGLPLGYFWMTSARLYANLELLAGTDALTNLPNRRALKERALHEMKRSRLSGEVLAVLALDIDHFKRINDQYGHDAGDTALGETAGALAGTLRKQDVVARLGGEEFVILLPDTDRENAVATAHRLRQVVEDLEIKSGPHRIKVTASFGIAVLQADDTFETVLQRADRALYAAKLAGRNYVMPEILSGVSV